MSAAPKLPDEITACLFDLDGVLTETAKVHAKAWKQMFDAYLQRRAERGGGEFVAFDAGEDYNDYVDGKPRYDGVRSFLESRGIELPEGAPEDPPGAETVCGLGNRKNELVLELLRHDGVEAYPGSVRFVEAARDAGLRRAVVSSSANCQEVLKAAGIEGLFEQRIDGRVAAEEQLAGQAGARHLPGGGAGARRRAGRGGVFEDALSGVEAGRAGALRLRRRRRPARPRPRQGAARARRDGRRRRPRRAARGQAMIDHPGFAVEPWAVRETGLDLERLAQSESVFALSNGHLGLRGNLDEGEPYALPGTYLNAFCETRPLPYAEAGYGYPEAGETVVNVTNGKIIRLLVDDSPFDIRYGELESHERLLDLRAGTLRRELVWRSPAGKRGAGRLRAAGLLHPARRRRDPLRGRTAGRRREAGRAVGAGRQRAAPRRLRGPARGGGAGIAAGLRAVHRPRHPRRPRPLDQGAAACGRRRRWTTRSTERRAPTPTRPRPGRTSGG